MLWQVLDDQWPVARKPHTCTVCVRAIQPGEKYRRLRVVTDDGAQTQKVCAHCELVSNEIWRTDPDMGGCCDEGLDVCAYLADYAPKLSRMFQRKWRNVGVDEIPLTLLPYWKSREPVAAGE